ncbi:MAG: retropepsin-like aspartic protease [Candidatus Auribacterota bacterium]
MGLILKRLIVTGDKGKMETEVLFDTGARRSVIRKDIAEKLATLINAPEPLKFRLADGKTGLTTSIVADIWIVIGDKAITDQFPVLNELSREIIVGANTLQNWEIKLDPQNESVNVGVDPNAIELL